MIAKMWKQPKCPLVVDWINRMLWVHPMEYYSSMKRNEILIHAIAWTNLGPLCQLQRTTYCTIFHLDETSIIGAKYTSGC